MPFKMIVDEQAKLLVFATKREYMEYLDSRDVELLQVLIMGQLNQGCPFFISIIQNGVMEKQYIDFISVSEIEIKYKNKIKVSERPKITGSHDAERILRPLFSEFVEYREAMFALYLNRANKVLGSFEIGVGGVCGVVS